MLDTMPGMIPGFLERGFIHVCISMCVCGGGGGGGRFC